jgi:hypothetical protein
LNFHNVHTLIRFFEAASVALITRQVEGAAGARHRNERCTHQGNHDLLTFALLKSDAEGRQ